MCMSAQQRSAGLRTASGELSAVLENQGLGFGFFWGGCSVWGFFVCFFCLAEQEISWGFFSPFTKREKKLNKEAFNVRTRWLSAVLPFS